MKAADVTAALASYVRTIRSHESRVDYFRAGQTEMTRWSALTGRVTEGLPGAR